MAMPIMSNKIVSDGLLSILASAILIMGTAMIVVGILKLIWLVATL